MLWRGGEGEGISPPSLGNNPGEDEGVEEEGRAQAWGMGHGHGRANLGTRNVPYVPVCSVCKGLFADPLGDRGRAFEMRCVAPQAVTAVHCPRRTAVEMMGRAAGGPLGCRAKMKRPRPAAGEGSSVAEEKKNG